MVTLIVKQLGKGLSFEYRDKIPWLVFNPEGGPKGQINLDILTSRHMVAPQTSESIKRWIVQIQEGE